MDILAFRFGRASMLGQPVGPTRKPHTGLLPVDPALDLRPDLPDMIIGEVKEGRATLNRGAIDKAVLAAAMARFGCCDAAEVEPVVIDLLRRGRAKIPHGHRVRLVAFEVTHALHHAHHHGNHDSHRTARSSGPGDKHAHHHEKPSTSERAGETRHAAHPGRVGHSEHGGHESHHAHMVADFRRRFWLCLVLSVPVIALAPMIQSWLGLRDSMRFTGDSYTQFAFATVALPMRPRRDVPAT